MNSSIEKFRKKILKKVNKTIANEKVKEFEISCLNEAISRRKFLKTTTGVSSLAGLASCSLMPSAWGAFYTEGSNNFDTLENLDFSAEEKAINILSDSDICEETISFQPAICEKNSHYHAVFESFNPQLRVQSLFDDEEPNELSYQNSNVNVGNMDMLQISKDSNGLYQLEHFTSSTDDTDEGEFTKTIIPNYLFKKGLEAPQKLIHIPWPNHNKVNPNTNKVVGFQCFYISCRTDIKLSTSNYEQEYIIWRRQEATPGLERTEIQIEDSGWQVARLWDPVRRFAFTEVWGCAMGQITEHCDVKTGSFSTPKDIKDGTEREYDINDINHYQDLSGRRYLFINYQFVRDDRIGDKRRHFGVMTLGDGADGWTPEIKFLMCHDETIFNETKLASLMHCSYDSQSDRLQAWVNPFMDGKKNNNACGNSQRYDSEDSSRRIAKESVVLNSQSGEQLPFRWSRCLPQNEHVEALALEAKSSFYFGINVDTDGNIRIPSRLEYPSEISHLNEIKLGDAWGWSLGDNGHQKAIYKIGLYNRKVVCCFTFTEDGHLLGISPLKLPDLNSRGSLIDLVCQKNIYGSYNFYALDRNQNLFLFREIENEKSSSGNQMVHSNDVKKTYYMNDFTDSIGLTVTEIPEFSTDETSLYDAFWLGNIYAGIYANPRCLEQAEFLAIKQALSGSQDHRHAYFTYNKRVDQSWSNELVTQYDSDYFQQQQEIETNHYFQLNLSAANAYMRPTFLAPEQRFEIRSASPCKVINNDDQQSYSISRTTSCIVKADEDGCCSINVKSQSFSCVLLVRIIDCQYLDLTSYDDLMVTDEYDDGLNSEWQFIELGEKAQVRLNQQENLQTSTMQEVESEMSETVEFIDVGQNQSQSYECLASLLSNVGQTIDEIKQETAVDIEQSNFISATTIQQLSVLNESDKQRIDPLTATLGYNVISPQTTGLIDDINKLSKKDTWKKFGSNAADWIEGAVNTVSKGLDNALKTLDDLEKYCHNGLKDFRIAGEFLNSHGFGFIGYPLLGLVYVADFAITVTFAIFRFQLTAWKFIASLISLAFNTSKFKNLQRSVQTYLEEDMFGGQVEQFLANTANSAADGLVKFKDDSFLQTQFNQPKNALNSSHMQTVFDAATAISQATTQYIFKLINNPYVKKVIKPIFNYLVKQLNNSKFSELFVVDLKGAPSLNDQCTQIIIDLCKNANDNVAELFVGQINEVIYIVEQAFANPSNIPSLVAEFMTSSTVYLSYAIDLMADIIRATGALLCAQVKLMTNAIKIKIDFSPLISCDMKLTSPCTYLSAANPTLFLFNILDKEFDFDKTATFSLTEMVSTIFSVILWVAHDARTGKKLKEVPIGLIPSIVAKQQSSTEEESEEELSDWLESFEFAKKMQYIILFSINYNPLWPSQKTLLAANSEDACGKAIGKVRTSIYAFNALVGFAYMVAKNSKENWDIDDVYERVSFFFSTWSILSRIWRFDFLQYTELNTMWNNTTPGKSISLSDFADILRFTTTTIVIPPIQKSQQGWENLDEGIYACDVCSLMPEYMLIGTSLVSKKGGRFYNATLEAKARSQQ